MIAIEVIAFLDLPPELDLLTRIPLNREAEGFLGLQEGPLLRRSGQRQEDDEQANKEAEYGHWGHKLLGWSRWGDVSGRFASVCDNLAEAVLVEGGRYGAVS